MQYMLSNEQAQATIIDMKAEAVLEIQVLAEGRVAEVTIGTNGGTPHEFSDYPTVEELKSLVDELFEIDLEFQEEARARAAFEEWLQS